MMPYLSLLMSEVDLCRLCLAELVSLQVPG